MSAKQDGRVDEAVELAVYEAWFRGEQGKPYDGGWVFARAAWLARAALAQNAQGEATPFGYVQPCVLDRYLSDPHGALEVWRKQGEHANRPIYLHAERARVPAGIEAAIAHIQAKADAYAEEHCGVEWDTGATTYHYGQAGEDYHHGLLELVDELQSIAAAPSQPAATEAQP